MSKPDFLNEFIKQCSQNKPEFEGEKFIGWEQIIFTLIGFGLKAMVPELKEWIKLGAAAIALKRQEIKEKLVEYAKEKELDFPAAEAAAKEVSDNINEENITDLIDSLENSNTTTN